MWQTSTLQTKLSTQPLSLISILSVKISSSFCSLCLLVAGGHNCGCYFFPVIFRGLGGKGCQDLGTRSVENSVVQGGWVGLYSLPHNESGGPPLSRPCSGCL